MAKTAIDWDTEGGRAWLERQGILSLISINETGTASSGDRQSYQIRLYRHRKHPAQRAAQPKAGTRRERSGGRILSGTEWSRRTPAAHHGPRSAAEWESKDAMSVQQDLVSVHSGLRLRVMAEGCAQASVTATAQGNIKEISACCTRIGSQSCSERSAV